MTTVQYGPTVSQYGHTAAQYGPTVAQYGPTVAQYGPTVSQYGHTAAQYGPTVAQYGPNVMQYGPTVAQVWMESKASVIQSPWDREKLVRLERWPEWTGQFDIRVTFRAKQNGWFIQCSRHSQARIREVSLYGHTKITYVRTVLNACKTVHSQNLQNNYWL